MWLDFSLYGWISPLGLPFIFLYLPNGSGTTRSPGLVFLVHWYYSYFCYPGFLLLCEHPLWSSWCRVQMWWTHHRHSGLSLFSVMVEVAVSLECNLFYSLYWVPFDVLDLECRLSSLIRHDRDTGKVPWLHPVLASSLSLPLLLQGLREVIPK